MDFGMPTLIEFSSLDDNIALCRELGLKFIELNQNLPDYQPERLRDAIRRIPGGLYATVHLDENLNPLDFNSAVAEAWTQTALSTVHIAREQGVPVVNLHFPQGVYFTLPGEKRYLFDVYWNAVREKLLRFRDRMTDCADFVQICVENTEFGRFRHLPDALDLLLESPAFSLTYDCGHDYTDGCRAKDFYGERRDRLTHQHLHDSTAKSCHLALGTGELDYEALLDWASPERAVLEVKTAQGLRESVEELYRKGILHG